MFCDYNTIKGRLPIDVNAIIYSKYSTDLKNVRQCRGSLLIYNPFGSFIRNRHILKKTDVTEGG